MNPLLRPLAVSLILLLLLIWDSNIALAQTAQKDANARALRGYMQPYQVTKLEWELLQFNLVWSGSYSTPASYLTSYPVFFDNRSMRFRTIFNITERREYQDPDLWSQLSRVKRESILQGAVDQLRDLLGQSFSEVKSRPELLFIEFKFKHGGGGFVNAARFENGTLTLAD